MRSTQEDSNVPKGSTKAERLRLHFGCIFDDLQVTIIMSNRAFQANKRVTDKVPTIRCNTCFLM